MPLYINGVYYDYGDRVIINGRRCASGWINGRPWSLLGTPTDVPVTPPPVVVNPPTIFNGIVMPDVSRQALSADYVDNLARYFTTGGQVDSLTYTATSSESFVTVDVSAGLRLSFGYPGLTAGTATVTVTATATNSAGSASATATFDVTVTLNNRVVIPVDNIRPPDIETAGAGGYVFGGDEDLAPPFDTALNDPTWQQVVDLATDYGFTGIGINALDADDLSLSSRRTMVGSVLADQMPVSLTFQKDASELNWATTREVESGLEGNTRIHLDEVPTVGSDVDLAAAIGDGRAYFIFDWN